MNEENAFLPHFLEEEIYIIDEPTLAKDATSKPIEESISAGKVMAESVVEEPSQVYEKPQVDKVIEEKEEIVSLTYQGQNKQNILLIVNSILPEEKAFLEKVLGAVKLTIDDCALLQLSENSSSQHHALIEQFKSDTVINFGNQNLNFLQNINGYKITYVDDKKILVVDHLKPIMGDVAKKKQLWECLQQLF